MSKSKTLIITHDHCKLHGTRQISPERPKRLKWVMTALEQLDKEIQKDLKISPLEIRAMETSEHMLAALEEQLVALSKSAPSARPSLQRSISVGYLEEKILPAVKAVHTRAYIERLATSCVSLQEKADGTKVALDDDTVVSASSLSAALCAVLSCCYAVDACCDPMLPYANAFAVIRPPGHHAGSNGPTAGPQHFSAQSNAAAQRAQPVACAGYMPPPSPRVAPQAFAFAHEPIPCDGSDCSQGFCLLNNAAIAARHALVRRAAWAPHALSARAFCCPPGRAAARPGGLRARAPPLVACAATVRAPAPAHVLCVRAPPPARLS